MSAENLVGTLGILQTSKERLPEGRGTDNQKREGCYFAASQIAQYCAVMGTRNADHQYQNRVQGTRIAAQMASENAIRFGSTRIASLAQGSSSDRREIDSFIKTFSVPEVSDNPPQGYLSQETSLQSALPDTHILRDFLTAKKGGYKGLVYNDPTTKRRLTISSFSGSSNGLVIERRQGEEGTVAQGGAAEQSPVNESTNFDIIFFSNLEWENVRLAVENPDYSRRYAVLKNALISTPDGGLTLRGIPLDTFVNAQMKLIDPVNWTCSPNSLPVLVSDPRGHFFIWRNIDRLPTDQLEIISVTSPALVAQVTHASGNPDQAIRRLKRLNTQDTLLRLSIRDESITSDFAAENERIKRGLSGLSRDAVYMIDIDQADGLVGMRPARIAKSAVETDGSISLKMEYYSTSNGWVSVTRLQFSHCEPLDTQVRDYIPFVGDRRILVQ